MRQELRERFYWLKMDAKVIQINLFSVLGMLTDCSWLKVAVAIATFVCAIEMAIILIFQFQGKRIL